MDNLLSWIATLIWIACAVFSWWMSKQSSKAFAEARTVVHQSNETMERLLKRQREVAKANAEVASLNADLQREIAELRQRAGLNGEHIALVVVRGGVAETYSVNGPQPDLIDVDNIDAGDPPEEIPDSPEWRALIEQTGLYEGEHYVFMEKEEETQL